MADRYALIGTRCAQRFLRYVIAFSILMAPCAQAATSSLAQSIASIFSDIGSTAPGCVAGVANADAKPVLLAYGHANVEQRRPMQARTVFSVGTLSHQFTAAAILLLQKQGKLKLDTPLDQYIPEIPEAGRKITIRHALHYLSGLRDYAELQWLAGEPYDGQYSAEHLLTYVRRHQTLNFESPGDLPKFTATDYFLLGRVVERVSGQALGDFLANAVFKPLGMLNTSLANLPGKERATGYGRSETGERVADVASNSTGAPGVQSTAEDLMIWAKAMWDNRLGISTQLLAPGKRNGGYPIPYASGLGLATLTGDNLAYVFSQEGALTVAQLLLPERKTAVTVLCNDESLVASERAFLIMQAIQEPAKASSEPQAVPSKPLSPQEAARYAGWYGLKDIPQLNYQISHLDGGLQLRGLNSVVARYRAGSAHSFTSVSGDAEIRFHFDAGSSEANRFTLDPASGGTDLHRLPPTRYSAAALREFSGPYIGTEFPIRFTLKIDQGSLWLQRASGKPHRLAAVLPDHFVSEAGRILRLQFYRDAQGRIAELSINGHGVRQVRFYRDRTPGRPTASSAF